MKNTLGPWTIEKSSTDGVYVASKADRHGDWPIICKMTRKELAIVSEEEMEANASLIALAPDLQETLRDIVACIHMPLKDMAPHLERAQKLLQKLGVWEEK